MGTWSRFLSWWASCRRHPSADHSRRQSPEEHVFPDPFAGPRARGLVIEDMARAFSGQAKASNLTRSSRGASNRRLALALKAALRWRWMTPV